MKIGEITDLRTIEQNKKLWALLTDVSRQVEWEVNGHKCYLDNWDWKTIFTAAFRKHHRLTRGVDGGFVILGMGTSRMTKPEMSDLFMIIEAFGNERGVRWSEPIGNV